MPQPIILEQIVESLLKSKFELSRGKRDGRVNSILAEDQITDFISKNFENVTLPEPRDWWDFSIVDSSGQWYPVNIKVTRSGGNDNLSSKAGLFYALTGLDPDVEEISINSWKSFFRSLKKNLNPESSKDYHFLVVEDIGTTGEINSAWVTSLKALHSLNPNGNNLPFQCRWSDNRIPVNRTGIQAQEFLLGTLEKSIRLRAKILDEFISEFPERS